MMLRRTFLKGLLGLAALPLVGRFVPVPDSELDLEPDSQLTVQMLRDFQKNLERYQQPYVVRVAPENQVMLERILKEFG